MTVQTAAKPINLNAYKVRETVTEVTGYWTLKTKAMIHSAHGKCMVAYEGGNKSLEWAEGQLDENKALVANGEPQTILFCTRCFLTPITRPAPNEGAAAVEVVEAVASSEEIAALADSIAKAVPAKPKTAVKRLPSGRRPAAKKTA